MTRFLHRLALSLAVVAFLAPSSAYAQEESCILGNRPAATLLIPYFEVDLDDFDGRTTLLSINNADEEATLARVVVWTDCHLPVLAFDVFLEADDVATINLRRVLVDGILPETSPGAGGLETFPSCTDPITNPTLDAASRAVLRAQLTGQPNPDDGLCYGSDRDQDELAVGFLTVDALNDCSQSIRLPDDEGYFVAGGNGLASNDNVLWGDYYLLEPAEDFAQGFEAVSVVADPDRFEGTDIRSFYQVTDDEQDDRLPISSRLRTRFLNGGGFTGSTQFLIWAQRSPEIEAFTCGEAGGSCARASDLAFNFGAFDEEAQSIGGATVVPPAFVTKVDVRDLFSEARFGFLNLESTAIIPVGPPGFFEERQAWMLQLTSALGRFSVGLGATRLNDLCQVPSQGE